VQVEKAVVHTQDLNLQTIGYRWRTSTEITSAILKSIPLASEENCYVPLI
jgi:hypothetical protein